MSKTSSFSSAQQVETLTHQQLLEMVGRLSDLQVKMLAFGVIAEQSTKDESGIDKALIKERDSWKVNSTSITAESAKERIRNVINVFAKSSARGQFSPDFLQRVKDFSQYMAEQIANNSGNHGQSQKVMYYFCDYLCQVSLLPAESRKIYLENFPPSQEYLRCIGGTEERIEALMRELTSSQERKPFLRAHEVAIRQNVDRLKYSVFEGNQVHIPKYLEYSLGLRRDNAIHPQSQTLLDLSWMIHSAYPKMFKDRLALEINPIQDDLERIINLCPDAFPNRRLEDFSNSSEEVFKTISVILAPYEIEQQSFIKESDMDGFYCIDQDLLAKAVANIPAVKYLDQFLARSQDLAQNTSPEDQNIAAAILRENSELLFSKHGSDFILQLLTQEGREELLTGVEALWMLGDKFANNSPSQFVQIVSALNAIEPDYLSTRIAPRIAEFLPFQAEKIERIKQCYDTHAVNSEVVTYLSFPEHERHLAPISAMFAAGAPLEDILQHITDCADSQTLVDELVTGLEDLERQNAGSYFKACQQVILRPDCKEIFLRLSQKINQSQNAEVLLPHRFARNCLSIAAQKNLTDICRMLLSDFAVNPQVFAQSSAVHSAAMHNNPELIELFAEKGCDPNLFVNTRDENGHTVLDIATLHGSVDAIRMMVAKGMVREMISDRYPHGKFLPLYLAAKSGNNGVIKIFASWGVDLAVPSAFQRESQNTAAHFAVINNKDGVIRTLRENGVSAHNLNLVNGRGYTPFEMATYLGLVDRMKELRDAGITVEMMTRSRDSLGDISTHIAAREGHVGAIEALQEFGVDLNARNAVGDTALHKATEAGEIDAVRALIRFGVNLDAQNNSRESALHRAIAVNNANIVKVLIGAGANATLLSRGFLSPLALARDFSRGGEIVQALCSWEGEDKNTVIHNLVSLKDHRTIAYVLDKGIDVQSLCCKQNKDGDTPLMLAADGDNRLIKLLIDIGRLSLNLQNNDGDSAMHKAIVARNSSAVLAIYKAGADIGLRNKAGRSPLDLIFSKEYRNKDLIKSLYKSGLDLEDVQYSERKDSLMHLAIKSNDIEMAEILKYADVDFNRFLPDAGGKSIMDWALHKGENGKKFVKILEEAATRDANEPRLIRFIREGNQQLVERACKNGAELQYRSPRGDTPAHFAAAKGDEKILNILARGGVDVNAANNNGETPADIAANAGHTSFLQYLNLKLKDANGNLPLHRAILRNNIVAVRNIILADGHGQLNLQNNTTTPLNLAAQVGGVEIIKYLLNTKRVDVNSQDQNGRTALDFAVSAPNCWEVVKCLRSLGAKEASEDTIKKIRKNDFAENMRQFSAGLTGQMPPPPPRKIPASIASSSAASLDRTIPVASQGKPSKSPVADSDSVMAIEQDAENSQSRK